MNKSNTVQTPALLIACALLLNASPAAAQDFALQFRNGLVTLVAREVTVPRILDRWARIGGTTIVNGEKVQAVPVTLQLVDVPEREALAILLRDVGGYILAERHDDAQGVSVIDQILVLPASAVPIRNPPPRPVVPPTVPSEISELQPAGAGQTAEGAVVLPAPAGLPQRGSSLPGAAPSDPQGNVGAASMPGGVSTGSAQPGAITTVPPALSRPGATPGVRPGEMTAPAPAPPVRQSPGPQPPPP